MKKTIHTLLTAAMFAVSNAMAMPAVAEDGNTGRPVVDPVETIRLEDPNWNSGQQENDPQVTTTTKLIEATKTTTVTLYGVCPSTTTIRDIYQMTTTTTTAPQPVYGPPLQDFVGDVNFDGYVDSFDILAVRKMLVKGTERYSDAQMEAYYADMNNDGKLSISDLILLQQYVLGKVTKQELQERLLLPKERLLAFYYHRVLHYTQHEIAVQFNKSQVTIHDWIQQIAEIIKKYKNNL